MYERTMYETILIPTDGSEQAERGVEEGLSLAEQHDAAVIALYVLNERRYGHTPALGGVELDLERIEDEAIEILTEITERARDRGLDAEHQCCRGLPWEKIVTQAEQHDVDLVVMGRRGMTDDRRTPLGSVTDRVIRSTDVPVQAV